MIQAKADFERWATGYSGLDGGNPRGPIWFCGIEWGGKENKDGFVFGDAETLNSISADKLQKFLRHKYSQSMVKLYAALMGEELKNCKEIANRKKVFAEDSDLFKLNLYPLSFPAEDDNFWEEWHFEKTGLPTKSLYRAWCQVHRFAKFTEWARHYAPKLIIGTGLSHDKDFVMAFGGVSKFFKSVSAMNTEAVSNKSLKWLPINDGKTILAIAPFLGGWHGLNSDMQLGAFGQRIGQICTQAFGKSWMLTAP